MQRKMNGDSKVDNIYDAGQHSQQYFEIWQWANFVIIND